jgi:probable HAF family extracellular repeat protein
MLGHTAPRPRRIAVALVTLGLAIGGTAPAGASPPTDGDGVTTTVLPHLFPVLGNSRPYDINDRGQVVGISSRWPALWPGTEVINIAPPGAWIGTPFDAELINNRGQVGMDVDGHAMLWQRGEIVDLDGDASFSSVAGLNDRGQALIWYGSGSRSLRLWDRGRLVEVFTAEDGSYVQHAALSEDGHVVFNLNPGCDGCPVEPYLWHRGAVTSLAPLAGAVATNRSGQVAGAIRTADGRYRAALWADGDVTDLGTLGDAESWPVDINDRGQVVAIAGAISTTGEQRSFLWENGETTDLGTLGGAETRAEMINERGQVTLQADAPDGTAHAVVWEDGDLIDLGEMHTVHDPVINERDQVIGYLPDRTAVIWQLP